MPGLYIHIPFCKQACSYCDFYFLTKQELRQPFVDALLKEIKSYKDSEFTEKPIKTIYIGGGTPSLLSEAQLESIFDELGNVFKLSPEEVTMELNPDDVSTEYLRQIKSVGVNRASMGVQSFHSEILDFMHRAHNSDEAIAALEALQKADFPSFTADLIYGNPGQSLEMLEWDIVQLLQFDPPHISAYSLTIESNTRLGKQVELGRIDPPDDESVADHFDLVYNTLAKSGIEQYEVSNFSKPGKEAVHNSNYWRHENYLGLGPSAHSFWWKKDKASRWKNRSDLRHYLQYKREDYREDFENLDKHSLAEERIMLGLRTKWGVSVKELNQKYGYQFNSAQFEWIQDQVQKGTFIKSDEAVIMSSEGLKISDHLIVELLKRGDQVI
jgi:oxygen-independent coproporphyrinogen III oxidase